MKPQTANALPLGSKLHEFEILSILGKGGFGITYKVMDTHLDKLMVIKEYMPSQFASRSNNTTVTCISKDRDTFEWGLERFLDEAKLLSNFDHISIAKALRYFEANGTAYFVMEFYDGETLEDYLIKHPNKKFSQEEILSVMMPIIEGLKAVHSRGFLHRDIAPDNIFLRIDRPPILIDFGASRNALGSKSQNISAIVKHGYSPPEQYTASSKQDTTTDLYAISAVIYEMITGMKPPESTHRQSEVFNGNNDPIEDIKVKYRDRFSSSFLRTITHGLNIRQKDRVQSIGEFQSGLLMGQNEESNRTEVEPEEDSDKETVHPMKNNISHYLVVSVLMIGLLFGGYTMMEKMNADASKINQMEKDLKTKEEKAQKKEFQKNQIKSDTFVDSSTELTWQDNVASKSMKLTLDDASKYCRNLDIGGLQDWSIPSLNDLKSLYQKKDMLKNINPEYYWTADTSYGTGINYFVSYNGQEKDVISEFDENATNYIRCVRKITNASHAIDTDKEISSQRWIFPTDNICTSKGGEINDEGACIAPWKKADAICNESSGRLPTIDELKNAIDDCGGTSNIYNSDNYSHTIRDDNLENSSYQSCYKSKGFTSGTYWSSTVTPNYTSFAWDAEFHNGFQHNHDKTNRINVVCVD